MKKVEFPNIEVPEVVSFLVDALDGRISYSEKKRQTNLAADTSDKLDYSPLSLRLKPGEQYQTTTQAIADVLLASGAISREQWTRVIFGNEIEEAEDAEFSDPNEEFEQSPLATYEDGEDTDVEDVPIPDIEVVKEKEEPIDKPVEEQKGKEENNE